MSSRPKESRDPPPPNVIPTEGAKRRSGGICGADLASRIAWVGIRNSKLTPGTSAARVGEGGWEFKIQNSKLRIRKRTGGWHSEFLIPNSGGWKGIILRWSQMLQRYLHSPPAGVWKT